MTDLHPIEERPPMERCEICKRYPYGFGREACNCNSPPPAVPRKGKRRPPPKGWEDLDCVGGPACGSFMRTRTTEDSVHFRDGFYIRRHLDATAEQKRDPLWQLVRDVLDWQDDPQPLKVL